MLSLLEQGKPAGEKCLKLSKMATTEETLETRLERIDSIIRGFADKFNSTPEMKIYTDVANFVSCSACDEAERKAFYRLFLYLTE